MPPPLSHAPAKTWHSPFLSFLDNCLLGSCGFHLPLSFSHLWLRSSPPMCSMHDNIDTVALLLLWQRWPLSLSFVPHFISSLAKTCTIPAVYVEANVNTVGESRGQELKAGMVTQTVIDTGICIFMNTHICIISERKWYKYTHTHTLSCCRAKDVHTSRRRDRECHQWHLCALSLWWKKHAFGWDSVRVCVALNDVFICVCQVMSFHFILISFHLISWQECKGGINGPSALCSWITVIHSSSGSLLERAGINKTFTKKEVFTWALDFSRDVSWMYFKYSVIDWPNPVWVMRWSLWEKRMRFKSNERKNPKKQCC